MNTPTNWLTRDDVLVGIGDKVLSGEHMAKIDGVSRVGWPVVQLLTGPAAGTRLEVHPATLVGRFPG